MEVQYVENCNCYNVVMKVPIGKKILRLYPYIDTGATLSKKKEQEYTYSICFRNVSVSGHYMDKFHMDIMVHGSEDICVIGNDFLNMCNYQHRAGEKHLVIENPNAQRYYDRFRQSHVLEGRQTAYLDLSRWTV